MNREVELVSVIDQLLLPPLHRLSLPARNRILENRTTLVGHDQILINADHLAITLTTRAGTDRIVETEKVLGRLLEGHSVQLKARRVLNHLVLLIAKHDDATYAAPQFVGSRNGVTQSTTLLLVVAQAGTINHNRDVFDFLIV